MVLGEYMHNTTVEMAWSDVELIRELRLIHFRYRKLQKGSIKAWEGDRGSE